MSPVVLLLYMFANLCYCQTCKYQDSTNTQTCAQMASANPTCSEDETKSHESWVPCCYKDTVGVTTIGYGFNIDQTRTVINQESPIDLNSAISTCASTSVGLECDCDVVECLTKSEGESIFSVLYTTAGNEAQGLTPGVIHPPLVMAAFTDMMYNLGLTRLSGFPSMIQALKDQRYVDAACHAENSKWCSDVRENRCCNDAACIASGDVTVQVMVIVKAASDGSVMGGVLVTAFVGPTVVSSTTSASGVALLELPTETYLIKASKAGFYDATQQHVITEATTIQISLSAILGSGQKQAVLTWGQDPGDMDSHVVQDWECAHTFYGNRQCSHPNGAYVDLDVDDTSSFGPETVTFQSLPVGTYSYMVHVFDGNTWSEITANSWSPATVQLVSDVGNYGVVGSFISPSSGDSYWWHVFNIRIEEEFPCARACYVDFVNQAVADENSRGTIQQSIRLGCECQFGDCVDPPPPPPTFQSGDPHYVSLDGLKFDYMGLGTFWLLKTSHTLNVNIQTALFKLSGSSGGTFTGLAAMQVGSNIVTIATRLDGAPADVRVNNVVVSIGATVFQVGQGSSLVRISHQGGRYLINAAAGVQLGVQVFPLTSANREYINTDISLSVPFYDNTAGILGTWNDDQADDFMMPSGAIAADEVQFGDSWRVDVAETLLSAEERTFPYIDGSYFGETEQFDIASVDPATLAQAQTDCESVDVEYYSDCVLDYVVAGSDTLQQPLYNPFCVTRLLDCNNHGTCNGGVCSCVPGWTDPECSTPVCDSACEASPNGACHTISGFCICDFGFDGTNCDEFADCGTLNNCNTPFGECASHGVCECDAILGYTGGDCSVPPGGDSCSIFINGANIECLGSCVTGSCGFNALDECICIVPTDAPTVSVTEDPTAAPTDAITESPTVEGDAAEDPHFFGFGGGTFDFMGKPGLVFNIISDIHLQVNSKFVESPLGETFLGDFGIMVGNDKISLELDGGTVRMNNETLSAQIYRLSDGGRLIVYLDGIILEIPYYDFLIQLQKTPLRFRIHVDYKAGDRTSHPHGILGQTSDGVYRAGIDKHGKGAIEGFWTDYQIKDNDIFGNEFVFNKFANTKILYDPPIHIKDDIGTHRIKLNKQIEDIMSG